MKRRELIQIDPNVRFGKPCVVNTRIAVDDVMSWLSSGMSHDEIIADFPELTSESIDACIKFNQELDS